MGYKLLNVFLPHDIPTSSRPHIGHSHANKQAFIHFTNTMQEAQVQVCACVAKLGLCSVQVMACSISPIDWAIIPRLGRLHQCSRIFLEENPPPTDHSISSKPKLFGGLYTELPSTKATPTIFASLRCSM